MQGGETRSCVWRQSGDREEEHTLYSRGAQDTGFLLTRELIRHGEEEQSMELLSGVQGLRGWMRDFLQNGDTS